MMRFLAPVFAFATMVCGVVFCGVAQSQDASKQSSEPATASQAAAILDLSTFPMIDAAEAPNTLIIAAQSYTSKGTVVDVAKKIQAELLKRGFRETPGVSITDDYASGNYQGKGFTVTLSVFPASTPNTAQVNLQNLGNVDLAKLPVPTGAKSLYAMPSMIAYVVESPVEKTNAEVKNLLLKQGWEHFGDTTASFFVKKNAVRLQVMVSESPGQDGKTVIQISSEQLSADLPVPPSFVFLQYSDSTGGMIFDSEKSQDEVVAFFKQSLGKTQWKPTTDNVVRIGFEDHLIFRNDKKEMIEITFRQVEGKTRAELKYQTAKQFAEDMKKADEQIAILNKKREAEMERKKNPPKVAITAPGGATIAESDADSIDFTTKSGAAKGSLEAWMKAQEAKGWKRKVTIDTKEAGDFTLEKEGIQIEASFIDPGFIPGSITISVRGDYQLTLGK